MIKSTYRLTAVGAAHSRHHVVVGHHFTQRPLLSSNGGRGSGREWLACLAMPLAQTFPPFLKGAGRNAEGLGEQSTRNYFH